MKLLFATIKYLLILGVVAIAILIIGTMMPFNGGVKIKIVKSGSMEPAIHTGGIVIIKPESDYRVGDVITFGPDTKSRIPTTHRIVAIEGSGASRVFQTKGDANDAPDQTNTRIHDIEGKVIFSMPYVGYILDFARRPIGFGLLVGVPAFAIILDELLKIVGEVKKMRRKKQRKEAAAESVPEEPVIRSVPASVIHSRPSTDGVRQAPYMREMRMEPVRNTTDGITRSTYTRDIKMWGLAFLLIGSLFGFGGVGGTVSYFNDSEFSLGNLLKAGMVAITLSAENDAVGRLTALSEASSTEEEGDEKDEEYAVGSDLFAIEVGKGIASLPFAYSIDAILDPNNPAECKRLELEAWIGDQHWSGEAGNFHFPKTSDLGRTQFLLTIPVPNTMPSGAECKGSLLFTASLAGVPDSVANAFHDSKSYDFTIKNPEQTPVISEEKTETNDSDAASTDTSDESSPVNTSSDEPEQKIEVPSDTPIESAAEVTEE